MYSERKELIKTIENQFDTVLLVYVTSDRPGAATQIAPDAIDSFINQLDKIGVVKKITLFLYTNGGDTLAAWNIVNLIKMYCDEFEVIIPQKAKSAGTLISLGADSIIMTKQAVLGPIDPSLVLPVDLKTGNGQSRSISVEAAYEYLSIAKNDLNIKDDRALADILIKFSETVDPLTLGQVFRTRRQIHILADKLLASHMSEEKDRNNAIDFLCSKSGSHDYTINRREAKDNLKLNIKLPNPQQYEAIKKLYDDIVDEMEMRKKFDPSNEGESFLAKMAAIETKYESDMYVTEGTIQRQIYPNGTQTVQPIIAFQGWRKME